LSSENSPPSMYSQLPATVASHSVTHKKSLVVHLPFPLTGLVNSSKKLRPGDIARDLADPKARGGVIRRVLDDEIAVDNY